MSSPLFFLDPGSDLSLQDQVRRKLVDAACAGAFPPGRRLPSSRALAAQLNIARNTVTLAYQKLVDQYYYAQCWDPKGWFWKPAEAAQQALDELGEI